MKISASIYSDKENDVLTTVKNLDSNNVDMIHVDCKDDLNVFADIEIMQRNILKHSTITCFLIALLFNFSSKAQETTVDDYKMSFSFKTTKKFDNTRVLEVNFIGKNREDRKDKIPVLYHYFNLMPYLVKDESGNWLKDSELKVFDKSYEELRKYNIGGLNPESKHGKRWYVSRRLATSSTTCTSTTTTCRECKKRRK